MLIFLVSECVGLILFLFPLSLGDKCERDGSMGPGPRGQLLMQLILSFEWKSLIGFLMALKNGDNGSWS